MCYLLFIISLSSYLLFYLFTIISTSYLLFINNIYFFFFLNVFTMKIKPFSKCENRSDSQIWCPVKTWVILTKQFSSPMKTVK